ncbi:hypothetical protein D3C76_651530 [compost metagenome]
MALQASAFGGGDLDVLPFTGGFRFFLQRNGRPGSRRCGNVQRLAQRRELSNAADERLDGRRPFMRLQVFGGLLDVTVAGVHRDRVGELAHEKRIGLVQVFTQNVLDGCPFTLLSVIGLTTEQSAQQRGIVMEQLTEQVPLDGVGCQRDFGYGIARGHRRGSCRPVAGRCHPRLQQDPLGVLQVHEYPIEQWAACLQFGQQLGFACVFLHPVPRTVRGQQHLRRCAVCR